LRHLGGQIIVLAFVLLDIDGLGFALVSSIWLTPWVAINVTALVFGSLSWSEDKRIRRESATATWRQGEKVRAAEWWSLGELQRKAQRQHQQAERRQRQEEDEREAQKRLQAALRQAQEELREAEQRRYQEEKERETQKQQQSERAERLRQTQQQEREAQQRRRQAEEEREAQRKRGREHKRVAAQFKSDWWTVLGVAPSASKDEIVRKYRHKIKQCYADRVSRTCPGVASPGGRTNKGIERSVCERDACPPTRTTECCCRLT
jgi:hypothetical protein